MKKLSLIICLLCAAALCACSTGGSGGEQKGTQVFTKPAATADSATPAEAEPEEADSSELDELIAGMSVEEKVGQMFYARCPDAGAEDWVTEYHLGGYVLFYRDFEDKTAEEISDTIAAYQEQAKIPLLIGVDEEGGDVIRVSANENLRYAGFLSPKEYYLDGGMDRVREIEAEKAQLLKSLGINVNMAPVCDVTSDESSFMYSRSFSADEELACEFVSDTVGIYSENKLGSVLKHFPGYGDCEDTHTGVAYDDRAYSDFTNRDFKPFEAGIKAGADCILVSHNIVSCMDADCPASLSDKVHRIIREDLDFGGVIMTDDLAMDAITDYTGTDSAAVLAVKSGNDLICCSDVETQYPAVLEAVKNGEINEQQIDISVKRILKFKQKLEIV